MLRTAYLLIFALHPGLVLSQAQQIEFLPVGPATRPGLHCLSSDGEVLVGRLMPGGGAFRWTSSTGIVPLGDIGGGAGGEAQGTSEEGGIIVGVVPSAGPMFQEAFRWTLGSGMAGLGGLPGASSSTAYDVSLDGAVVVGKCTTTKAEAFRWTASTGMVPLTEWPEHVFPYATNRNGSVVVGAAYDQGNSRPFRWTAASRVVLLGFNGDARDVSADGDVVVGQTNGTAFKWTPASGTVNLGDLPGGQSISAALGVSDSGLVVVGMGRGTRGGEAVFWLPSSPGPISLMDHLTSLGVTAHQGWWLATAWAVSADGLAIAGSGTDPFGQEQAWVVRFPEPWGPYCTAKVNSLGCTPSIAGEGVPSAANVWSFEVAASDVRNQKAGVFIYKVGGTQTAQPFQGGTLCIGPTGIRRTIGVNSGGNPAPADDCSGVYSIDMNAFAAGLLGGNPDPALQTPGGTYHVQAWGRDQGFPPPNNTTLSNALEVPIGP